MSKRRILLGLVVMAGIEIGADRLLSVFDVARLGGHEMVQSVLVVCVAAFAGGWVARRRFLLPALAFWFVIWAAIVYLYYSLAVPTGQASILTILQACLNSMAWSGAATAVGVVLGQMLASGRARSAATAA